MQEMHPEMEQKQNDTSLLAARAAVLVMRAAIPGNPTAGQVTLLAPSLPGLWAAQSDAEIAAALARLPKPQSCISEVQERTLTVRCEPLARGDAEVHRGAVDPWFAAGVEGFLGLEPESRPEPGTRHVLLIGAGEELLLPFEVLETYFREYIISVSHGFGRRSPTDAERRRGAAAVWEVQPSQGPPPRIVEYPE